MKLRRSAAAIIRKIPSGHIEFIRIWQPDKTNVVGVAVLFCLPVNLLTVVATSQFTHIRVFDLSAWRGTGFANVLHH